MKVHLRAVYAAVGALAVLTSAPVLAQDAQSLINELPQAGQGALQIYGAAEPNKAFAVGPDGSWGWQAGAQNLQQAQILAKQRCEERIEGECMIVASESRPEAPPVAQGAVPGIQGLIPGTQGPAVPGTQGIVRMEAVPTMSPAGHAAYQSFLQAEGAKAFAVSPQGAWGWQASSQAEIDQVAQEALARCMQHDADCRIIATGEGEAD